MSKYIAVSIHWGKYCGHCLKKKMWRKAAYPIRKDRKICTDQRRVWIHQQLVPALCKTVQSELTVATATKKSLVASEKTSDTAS